jgi:hypothetical protein
MVLDAQVNERREREKFTHEQVGYEHPAKGEYSCNGCKHFIRVMPPRCEIVRSPIRAKDWCRRWADGHSYQAKP